MSLKKIANKPINKHIICTNKKNKPGRSTRFITAVINKLGHFFDKSKLSLRFSEEMLAHFIH